MATGKWLTQADARRLALALPETRESAHMGTPDLRVRDKIFATLPVKFPGTVNLRVTAANLDALVRRDPETFRDVWGGRWLGVTLARIGRRQLADLLRDAWELAAGARRKARPLDRK
jgi:hypothetical protein